ncbi:hypothetical protein AB0365_16830, partial [Brevibacterium casei]|uniref:hypothetical protein n=1 Tax=Brevibacterium casei TaxID=33889 RepID=UPI003450FD16
RRPPPLRPAALLRFDEQRVMPTMNVLCRPRFCRITALVACRALDHRVGVLSVGPERRVLAQ